MRTTAALFATALVVGCASTSSSGRSLLKIPPQEAPDNDIEAYLRRDHSDSDPSRQGFPLSSAIWPMMEVKVGWENPTDANATQREWVKDAVLKTWCAHSALRLTGWGEADASTNIRIHIADDQPHTKGLGRQLDKKAAGMVLNFTFSKWKWWSGSANPPPSRIPGASPTEYAIRVIAVHEFGHAIGIAHEQNRGDTPEGGPGCAQPQGDPGDFYIGPWDATSCMNYRNKKWSNWGQLSEGDKATIAFIYPTTPGSDMTGTWSASGTSGDATVRIDVDLKQEKTLVTGTARVAFKRPGLTREVHYPVRGRRISTVAIFYPQGSVDFFSAINNSPERRVEYRSDGTATVDGQPLQDPDEFRRICQEEMKLAHYVAQKVFCVTSSASDGRCEITSGGLRFNLTLKK